MVDDFDRRLADAAAAGDHQHDIPRTQRRARTDVTGGRDPDPVALCCSKGGPVWEGGGEGRVGHAALGNGAHEQAARQRREQQVLYGDRTSGLAGEGDLAGVAAERADVVVHPAQCGDDVL